MVQRSERFSNPPIIKKATQSPKQMIEDASDEDEFLEVRDFGTDTKGLEETPQRSVLTAIDDNDDEITEQPAFAASARTSSNIFPQLPLYEVASRPFVAPQPKEAMRTQNVRLPVKRHTDSALTSASNKRSKFFIPRKPPIRRKHEPKRVFAVQGPIPMIVEEAPSLKKRKKAEVKRIGKRPKFEREAVFDHDVVMGTLPESSYNIAQNWQSID